MRYAHGLGTFLVLFIGLGEARAQLPVGPFPVGGFGFQTRRSVIGVGFGGGFSTPGCFAGSAPFGNPGGLVVLSRPQHWHDGPTFNHFTFVTPPPIFSAPPPIIIQQSAPPPIVIQQPAPPPNLVDPIIIRPRDQQPAPLDLPGDVRGGFRAIRPEDRVRAMQAGQPDKPADKKPDGQRPNEPERNDPIFQGRQAFANREYGRALRFFKQAVEDHPDNPIAYFLSAEAQFALGKYRDAAASIHSGLRLDKEWPGSRFRPAALYGANAADYTEQVTQLQEALKRHPTDAVLLFLSAYHLWFDGQEDEARRLFGQARKLVTEPRFIDLFLLGPPGGPVVAR